jgi:hypothetical protein
MTQVVKGFPNQQDSLGSIPNIVSIYTEVAYLAFNPGPSFPALTCSTNYFTFLKPSFLICKLELIILDLPCIVLVIIK